MLLTRPGVIVRNRLTVMTCWKLLCYAVPGIESCAACIVKVAGQKWSAERLAQPGRDEL